MSRYYTDCEECRKCLDFCAEGNISVPCEHDNCPNEDKEEN